MRSPFYNPCTIINMEHISNTEKSVCLKHFSGGFYDTRIVIIAVKGSSAKNNPKWDLSAWQCITTAFISSPLSPLPASLSVSGCLPHSTQPLASPLTSPHSLWPHFYHLSPCKTIPDHSPKITFPSFSILFFCHTSSEPLFTSWHHIAFLFFKYIYWLCYYSCLNSPPHSTPSCPPLPSQIPPL